MTYASKRWSRMAQWCEKNPAELCADYRDVLPDDLVSHLLAGEMGPFWEGVCEMEFDAADYPGFWDYWEAEFAAAFGYDGFSDMPAPVQDIAFEHRWVDSRDFLRTLCRNTSPKVVAVLKKRDGELIYGPSIQGWSSEEYARARYIRDAFGFEGSPSEVARRLEVVYGGYDMECAVLIGTLDLWAIVDGGRFPTTVEVGPEDSDNLLWYEFFNGCGNMGSLPIQKRRRFSATFHLDGSRGYGVDACYGFCGSVWSHELRAA